MKIFLPVLMILGLIVTYLTIVQLILGGALNKRLTKVRVTEDKA